jgi:hypothetical protein
MIKVDNNKGYLQFGLIQGNQYQVTNSTMMHLFIYVLNKFIHIFVVYMLECSSILEHSGELNDIIVACVQLRS